MPQRVRVQIRRSKTKTGINNVIPREVAETLLKVANGNPKYIFWSGNGEPVAGELLFRP